LGGRGRTGRKNGKKGPGYRGEKKEERNLKKPAKPRMLPNMSNPILPYPLTDQIIAGKNVTAREEWGGGKEKGEKKSDSLLRRGREKKVWKNGLKQKKKKTWVKKKTYFTGKRWTLRAKKVLRNKKKEAKDDGKRPSAKGEKGIYKKTYAKLLSKRKCI